MIQKVYDSGRHGRKDRGLDHLMNGLVSHIQLENFGDLSNYSQGADDNEGLWTAEFAAGMVFRHMVTGSKQAKDIAIKNFYGMELLTNLTQVRGLLSRKNLTLISYYLKFGHF